MGQDDLLCATLSLPLSLLKAKINASPVRSMLHKLPRLGWAITEANVLFPRQGKALPAPFPPLRKPMLTLMRSHTGTGAEQRVGGQLPCSTGNPGSREGKHGHSTLGAFCLWLLLLLLLCTYIYVCLHVCTYVCVYEYICICIMYVCMFVYMYVCMYF